MPHLLLAICYCSISKAKTDFFTSHVSKLKPNIVISLLQLWDVVKYFSFYATQKITALEKNHCSYEKTITIMKIEKDTYVGDNNNRKLGKNLTYTHTK